MPMVEITRKRYEKLLASGRYVRSLHYHETPLSRAELYKAQLSLLAKQRRSLTDSDLRSMLTAGNQDDGVWIGCFDGYRTCADVLAPLFEQFHLKAHILLVTDFLDGAMHSQEDEIDRLLMESTRSYSDSRYSMTWQEAALLTSSHEIVNHTVTHCRTNDVARALHEAEMAQNRIRNMLNLDANSIAFLGGESILDGGELQQGLKNLSLEYAVGIELEYPALPKLEEDFEIHLPETNDAAEILEYYRKYQKTYDFTDGIPSILPMSQAHPCFTEANLLLASRFSSLVSMAMQEGETERSACLTALSALALHGMGKDFPMKESQLATF